MSLGHVVGVHQRGLISAISGPSSAAVRVSQATSHTSMRMMQLGKPIGCWYGGAGSGKRFGFKSDMRPGDSCVWQQIGTSLTRLFCGPAPP